MTTPWTRVDIAGRSCNVGPDDDGVDFHVFGPDLPGWSGPPADVELAEPTGAEGAVLLQDRAGARTVVVPGRVYAPTQELAWVAYGLLRTTMPGRRAFGDLVVHEPVPKRLRIKQGAVPRLTIPKGRRVTFELTLLALDPFKTALEATVVTIAPGGTEDVVNAGDEAAYVSVETTGAGTVWLQQDDSGAVMRSKDAVASGVLFDALAKTVTPSVQMLAPSQWLSVPADSTTPFTNLGTASLLLTVFDTYG